MELVLLGTGCPQCDPDRRGPASLVHHGGLSFLVDCGSGVTQRLVEAGTSGAAVDALLLTHLHSDHLVDFYQLVISGWHQGRDRKLRVFGPPGTRRFVDGTMELWRVERELRIAHEKRPSTRGLEVAVTEIGPGGFWDEGGVAIAAVAVAHQPVEHAYGFVFAAGGRRLVLSGDTAYCPALVAAARGADALLHECFLHREMKPSANRTPEGIASVAAYHTASDVVGKVAAEAGVGALILNHFVPTRFDRAALAAEVRRDWAGPLIVGEDLMRYDLDTRTLVHREFVVGLP
jgi:ribonuclease Z